MASADDNDKTEFKVVCSCCEQSYSIFMHIQDYQDWKYGEKLIQNALPYLTAAERELLISRTCDSCFKKIFSEKE